MPPPLYALGEGVDRGGGHEHLHHTRAADRTTGKPALTKKGGHMFRVGIFLDFVWLPARTMHPRGAYVRGARRNRIDRHGGEIKHHPVRAIHGVVGYPSFAWRLRVVGGNGSAGYSFISVKPDVCATRDGYPLLYAAAWGSVTVV